MSWGTSFTMAGSRLMFSRITRCTSICAEITSSSLFSSMKPLSTRILPSCFPDFFCSSSASPICSSVMKPWSTRISPMRFRWPDNSNCRPSTLSRVSWVMCPMTTRTVPRLVPVLLCSSMAWSRISWLIRPWARRISPIFFLRRLWANGFP